MRNDDYIDLARAMRVARERWRWILLTPVVAIVTAIVVSLAQTPQYDATATLLAGQGDGIADVQVISAVNQATQSLALMANDRVVVERTLDKAGLDDEINASELAGRVSVKVPTNTQQIELTVRDSDPKRAADLANAMAESFSDMVEKISRNSDLSASVWQPALVPTVAATPNTVTNALLAGLFGLFAGIAIAFLRDRLDTTWRNEREVEAVLGVPVLATIPEISARGARERVYA